MAVNWRGRLDLWLEAGLIDQATVDDIVEYEGRATRTLRSNWPVLLTLTLGRCLSGRCPAVRFGALGWALGRATPGRGPLLVAGFHLAGAILANRSGALSSPCIPWDNRSGSGYCADGQIFNLSRIGLGILLWAAGATAAYCCCATGRN